nr:amidohydrolase family protein [Arenimonas composti]
MASKRFLAAAFAGLAAAALALPAAAQDLLIRGATVHTAGAQGTLQDADVLVQGGVIRAVGPGLSAPAGIPVVDGKGRQLTPGFFGGLTALGLEEVSGEPSTVDHRLALGSMAPPDAHPLRPEFDVDVAFDPDSLVVGVNRVEGVAWTVLSPASVSGGSFIAGQGSAMRLDGRFDGPLANSRSLHVNLGGDALAMSGGSRAGQWMLLEQAIAEARSGVGDDLLTRAGRSTLARYLAGGRVVFHVDRAADIRQVLVFARRHGLKAVISGGAEAWRVAAELKAADVPVLLDALDNLPRDFDALNATLENAARLHRAGVRVAFSNGDTHNARRLRQIAGVAVANGLPWGAALAGLTSVPAQVFGVDDRIGRIAPGQLADLVLWDGDPLEVTTLPVQVWSGGVALPMRSRQTLLRDRYAADEGSLPRAYH